MQQFLQVFSSCNILIMLLQQFFKKVLSANFKYTDMLTFQSINLNKTYRHTHHKNDDNGEKSQTINMKCKSFAWIILCSWMHKYHSTHTLLKSQIKKTLVNRKFPSLSFSLQINFSPFMIWNLTYKQDLKYKYSSCNIISVAHSGKYCPPPQLTVKANLFPFHLLRKLKN